MTDSSSVGTLPELIRIDRRLLYIGRAPSADVRLPHPAVSRWHAELRSDGAAIRVRDLGSRSGTFVNGIAVTTADLREDDVVSFGPVTYEVKGGLLHRVLHTKGVKLEARGLTILRGERTVLADVNLTIPPDYFVGILGPSGAGKTTLLKGLTGFLPAASGQVFLDGLDIVQYREACRAMIGFVPQENVMYSSLTARENLDFALRLRVADDLRPDERAAWVAPTLQRLSLAKHADQPVRTLSGGECKRVSVAVELLSRPRLLFLDEPTAGLDPAMEARIMQDLRELTRRGTTVVCSTHVLESLDQFDAVIVVAGGRVLGSGSPQNLLRHFNVSTYAKLYEQLENPPGVVKHAILPPLAPSPAKPGRSPSTRVGTLSQITTQLLRGLLLVARDRVLLVLLIGQPLLIGFLISLSQINPGSKSHLNLICTFAVVASIWLGLNNTAREVVRDRLIYVRERRATINPESYLLAKVILFAGIGLVQVILLVFWLRYCNFLPRGAESFKEFRQLSLPLFLLVLWLTYLSAMLLGLLISTLAPTEEVAVAVLPLVVLPQLLLSAVATDLFWTQGGYFASLPIVLERAPMRGEVLGWLLEVLSFFTYSRPALVFFLTFDPNPGTRVDPKLAEVVNWAHLLFMLLATATVFVAIFLKRERRWLETT